MGYSGVYPYEQDHVMSYTNIVLKAVNKSMGDMYKEFKKGKKITTAEKFLYVGAVLDVLEGNYVFMDVVHVKRAVVLLKEVLQDDEWTKKWKDPDKYLWINEAILKRLEREITYDRVYLPSLREEVFKAWDKKQAKEKKKRSEDKNSERYWRIIGQLGWGTKSTNYKKMGKLLLKKYSKDARPLDEFVRTKREELVEELERYEKHETEDLNYYGVGDDGFWDLTSHIVGLGKRKYNAVMRNPSLAMKIGKERSYAENFQYIFSDLEKV